VLAKPMFYAKAGARGFAQKLPQSGWGGRLGLDIPGKNPKRGRPRRVPPEDRGNELKRFLAFQKNHQNDKDFSCLALLISIILIINCRGSAVDSPYSKHDLFCDAVRSHFANGRNFLLFLWEAFS
jgi:hypothetical protein